MLVLKHIEHPAHSEHWTTLNDGSIYITSYCPDNYPRTGITAMKRNKALKNIKKMLKEGWIMVFNSLFTNEEL